MSCAAVANAEPGFEVILVRKLNRDDKRALQEGELATFVRQYTRKAQRGIEPNDRRYDRGLESAVKRMPVDELDRLLHDDGDGDEDLSQNS